MEVPPRIELGIRELQSHALPLGYGTTLERMTRLELAIIPRKSCAFPGAPPRIKKGGGSEFGVCLRKKEKHRLKTMLRFGADDEARTRNHTPQKLRFSGGPTSN